MFAFASDFGFAWFLVSGLGPPQHSSGGSESPDLVTGNVECGPGGSKSEFAISGSNQSISDLVMAGSGQRRFGGRHAIF